MFENLNPYDRPTAIMEILIMLFVAFLIGFLIAWLLRKNRKESASGMSGVNSEIERLLGDITHLKKENGQLSSEKAKLSSELETHIDASKKLEEERSQKSSADEVITSTVPLVDFEGLQVKLSSLQSDYDTLGMEKSRLEKELENCLSSKTAVKAVVPEAPPEFVRKDIGIAPPSVHRIDDLKRIHGIGPFIEKKLNAVGIYTFEQISKFDKKDIDTVTDAIEFFPGRIERDDWVGQAGELKD